MTSPHCHKLFEQLSDQPFASAGIRPGGLDLTRRGLVLARLAPGDAVLDVGCGTGVTVRYLVREHAIRAVGLDASSFLVAQGKAGDTALPILTGNAQALPFVDESFDGVFLECMLSLVLDRVQVLQECCRILKPHGRIIVTDLYARNPEAIEALRGLSVRSCLRGALDKDRFLHECSVSGFGFACFEDHSDLLRDFAVQMIWTYGALDRFWTEAGKCAVCSGKVHQTVREAKPGYFLLVGFKARRLHKLF